MFQLIAIIIFAVSFLGVVFILYRKAPVLVMLPKNGHSGIKKGKLITSIERKVKATHFRLFAQQMLLHKLLSWVKRMTLRIETKTDALLHGIRKKAQELDKEIKKRK